MAKSICYIRKLFIKYRLRRIKLVFGFIYTFAPSIVRNCFCQRRFFSKAYSGMEYQLEWSGLLYCQRCLYSRPTKDIYIHGGKKNVIK